MDPKNNQNLDELTKTLLKKCEVSNLYQFYHKWVDDNDHSITIKFICAIHKNFNESKVLHDVAEISDLIIIDILDYTRKSELTKDKFLIDYIGMGKILNALKRKKILKKSTNLNEILKKIGITANQKNKTIALLEQAIDKKIIYANLVKNDINKKNPEYYLNFYSKITHPEHKKEFTKLIFTLIITIVSLSILIPIIIIINA